MRKFLLLVGLIVLTYRPSNVVAWESNKSLVALSQSNDTYIAKDLKLELFDRTTPAVFWDANSGRWLGGVVAPVLVYKELISFNVGLAAPLNESDNTTLLTGLDLRLTKPVKKGLDYLYNYLPFVRDHMSVVKKTTDLLSVGISGGYDYRNSRWNYGYFFGLTVPLPAMSVTTKDLSSKAERQAVRRIAWY
jgi:hypothetical protein